jgi:hypothetical protein
VGIALALVALSGALALDQVADSALLQLVVTVTELTALIVGVAASGRFRWVRAGFAGLLVSELALLHVTLWSPGAVGAIAGLHRVASVASAALLAIAVIATLVPSRRRAALAVGSPGAAASALRQIAHALVARAVVGIVALTLLRLAVQAGEGPFAVGVLVFVALGMCLTGVMLLVSVVRVGMSAGTRIGLAAAFLTTWSLVVAAIQAVVFYRYGFLASGESELAWLGVLTLLGPVAALAGLVALLETIPALVAAHCPGASIDTAGYRAWLVIPGLVAAFLVHLPFAAAMDPRSHSPVLAGLTVVAHLLPPLVLVPACLHAARLLDGATEPVPVALARA